MDEVLTKHIEIICQDLYDDDDGLIVIFGDEGAGKSVLESQIVKKAKSLLNCDFSIERDVHYFGKEFIKASMSKPSGSINCLDEARRTLSKMRMMSSANQEFMNFLSECRSQNQLNIILLPNFYDLDPDVATRRLKMAIKVVKRRDPKTKKLIRGLFQIVNVKDKNMLKELYKKRYEELPSYMISYEGKFSADWGWDEEEYKRKKEREKAKHYLEDKEKMQLNFTPRDYSTINHVLNYIKANRIINKVFLQDEAGVKAFQRLNAKIKTLELEDRQ